MLDEQPDSLVPHALRAAPQLALERDWLVNPSLRLALDGRCPNREAFVEALEAPAPTVWVRDPVTSVLAAFQLGATLARLVSKLRAGAAPPRELPTNALWALRQSGVIYEPTAVEAERAVWRATIQRARKTFAAGYAEIGQTLNPLCLGALRGYFRRFIRSGRAALGDHQSSRRWVAHNTPVARFVQHQLTPLMSELVGEPVKPSYTYLAAYEELAELPRHLDREQCTFSLSMLLDYAPEPEGATPWPLLLETSRGLLRIHQRLGESLAYRGCDLPHLREPLPSSHASTSLLLHYVRHDFGGKLA